MESGASQGKKGGTAGVRPVPSGGGIVYCEIAWLLEEMADCQRLSRFPLQEAFTVSVPVRFRCADPAAARDRAVVPSLLEEALLLAAVALLAL
jgi:hypothetical protein